MASQRPFWTQRLNEQENTYTIENKWITSHNYGPRGTNPVRAIVIHSMEGSIEGTYAHFDKIASEVSAHYGIAKDGRIWQFVPLIYAAYANGPLKQYHKWLWPTANPNTMTISIETEGKGVDIPLDPSLYDATLWLCRDILKTRLSITHLYTHNAISPTQCPGPRWLSGPLQQLGNELGLEVVI